MSTLTEISVLLAIVSNAVSIPLSLYALYIIRMQIKNQIKTIVKDAK